MTDLITDAKMLSVHARKKNIDVDDVRLSACQIQERHVSCPPARHVTSQLAGTKNSVALPVPGNKHGTRLPSDRFCLTGVNYRWGVGILNEKCLYANQNRNQKQTLCTFSVTKVKG